MKRATIWASLVIGSLLLLVCALTFFELARLMAPLGGIPFSWDFLALNVRWGAAFVLGILLVVAGLALLVRDRQEDG